MIKRLLPIYSEMLSGGVVVALFLYIAIHEKIVAGDIGLPFLFFFFIALIWYIPIAIGVGLIIHSYIRMKRAGFKITIRKQDGG